MRINNFRATIFGFFTFLVFLNGISSFAQVSVSKPAGSKNDALAPVISGNVTGADITFPDSGSSGVSGPGGVTGSGGVTGTGGVGGGTGTGGTKPTGKNNSTNPVVTGVVTGGDITLPDNGAAPGQGTNTGPGVGTNTGPGVGTNTGPSVGTNPVTTDNGGLQTTTQVGGVSQQAPGGVGKTGTSGPFGFQTGIFDYISTMLKMPKFKPIEPTEKAATNVDASKAVAAAAAGVDTSTAAPAAGAGAGAGAITGTAKASLPDSDTKTSVSTQSPAIAPNTDCEDNALKEINALLLKDTRNVLPIMFELTAMRLAKRALEQNPQATTFEELTRSNVDLLENNLKKANDPLIQKEAVRIYQKYGQKGDLLSISKDFQDMTKRNENACYFDQKNRFRNNEASAYVLAVTMGEKNSGLSEVDAATIWMVEKMRLKAEAKDPARYGIGKVHGNDGNLLNISTRVTRYLGRIKEAKNSTPEEMTKLINGEETKLKTIFADAYAKIQDTLKACIEKDPQCPNCSVDARMKAFKEKNIDDLKSMQSGLLSTVTQSDNLKIKNGLKAKIGETTFDFSNFAKEGTKAMVPSRLPRNKYDACKYGK